MFAIRATPGGIIVDSRGRRFANEAANYNDFGRSMHEFDPAEYSFPRVAELVRLRRRAPPRRAYRTARTRCGPDPDWLSARSDAGGAWPDADHGAAARAARDGRALQQPRRPRRRRGLRPRAPTRGTRYSADFCRSARPAPAADRGAVLRIEVQVGCLGTKGGLKIDGHARVLRADGSGPIPGLYAAGNAAANPFGMAYPSGGATVGPALVFGWLAGETAAHAG